MKITAALRLHTNLSAFPPQRLSPHKLVQELLAHGVQLAALTDINTALNCPAFAVLCRRAGIAPLFGMEAQTAEGSRELVLFADTELAVSFSDAWYAHLPPGSSSSQFYVDETGAILGQVEKPLDADSDVPRAALIQAAERHHGITIPADTFCALPPAGTQQGDSGAPFSCTELDIGKHPLLCADGSVNLAAVRAAFGKLPDGTAAP